MHPNKTLPTGTITFLFTDIESSTQLWEQFPHAMRRATARHDELTAAVIQANRGILVKSRGEGDSHFAVFERASDAVSSACALQQALVTEPWLAETPLRLRIGVHTGEADLRDGDYYGTAVNRCARLRAIAHGGQTLLSEATHALVARALPEGASLRDMGIHRLKGLQQPEHVWQVTPGNLPANFPPLRSLDALATNLPHQATSFVGREQELADVRRLLRDTRLLTLTGSGGTGKTRLAHQAVSNLLDEESGAFGDGVWVVELAPLSDPALVPQAVTGVLNVKEEAGQPPAQTLVDYLREKHLLLLLDNCEHVLDTTSRLADTLLEACPGVCVLATSREALNVSGEQTYRVPSLAEAEAVRLFTERALLARPDFTVTSAVASTLARLCHRLDGIPLALELAAARVRALSVEQVEARLGDRFRLLTGGSRTALPRQQTLRALIDWSYDLLSDAEKTVLCRCAVFAGGWTLEAAETVCSGGGIADWEVLDLLMALVDKSLVVPDQMQEGEPRYRLLETVRQYTLEKLAESGQGEAVRGQHLEYFLQVAEEPGAVGMRQREWLERLGSEHENLRTALDWCTPVLGSITPVDEAAVKTEMRLCHALTPFWYTRGFASEARERLQAVLSRPGEAQARTQARAELLSDAATLAGAQSDWGEHKRLYEESLAIYQEIGDERGIAITLGCLGRREESLPRLRALNDLPGLAMCLEYLGLDASGRGEYAKAVDLYTEALDLHRRLGDRSGEALLLSLLGNVWRAQGDNTEASVLYEQSLAISREVGNPRWVATALDSLGNVAWHRGDYAVARQFHEEALVIFRDIGNKQSIAFAVYALAEVARCAGEYAQARRLYEQSLVPLSELEQVGIIAHIKNGLGDVAYHEGNINAARALYQEALRGKWEYRLKSRFFLPYSLESLAELERSQGRMAKAARLWGAAEALRQELGTPLPHNAQVQYERSTNAARAELCDETFFCAWAEGRAASLEQTVEYALEDTV